MSELITASEAARMLGCSVEWLRVAEKEGKIPKAKRDVNGWRRYSPDDVKALRNTLFPDSGEEVQVSG